MTHTYPVHLRLEQRRVLVAGAGAVATRKIERLVDTGAELCVVAPIVSDTVRTLAQAGRLVLSEREVRDDDVEGALLVIAATDDGAVNARLAKIARACGALVLRVDAPSDSDFTLPAVIRGGVVEATVSTGGLAPAASRRLKRELRRFIEGGADRFGSEMAKVRRATRHRADASELLQKLGEGELFAACVSGDEARIQRVLDAALGESA